MHEWAAELNPDQRILDIGAGAGSLRDFEIACIVVAVDSDRDAFVNAYPSGNKRYVHARGESLPFASGSFDLVLCHHVLEHIDNPSATLAEVARLLKPAGRFYVAVPNGYGLCDRIYRFVFDGGEHVNRFRYDDLVRMVEASVNARLVYSQKLYTSFAYLARMLELPRDGSLNLGPHLRKIARLPKVLVLFVQGCLYWFTRLAGRVANVNWDVYGWALYFERGWEDPPETRTPFLNVCMYCGAGQPSNTLTPRYGLFCRCTECNRRSLYFPPYTGVQ